MCIDENAHCGGPDHYELQKSIIRAKKQEIISKLENGAERYQTDPLIHNVVEVLARGADPIQVIGELLKMNEERRRDVEQYMKFHATPTMLVPKHEAENFLKTIKK